MGPRLAAYCKHESPLSKTLFLCKKNVELNRILRLMVFRYSHYLSASWCFHFARRKSMVIVVALKNIQIKSICVSSFSREDVWICSFYAFFLLSTMLRDVRVFDKGLCCFPHLFSFVFFLQGIFIKDSNSLAYYNVTPSSVVQLQLKERGGRKKWETTYIPCVIFVFNICSSELLV